MKITIYHTGAIAVEPNPGRRIVRQFIDYETGYLVIGELREDDPTDRAVYYTLADSKTGAMIDRSVRAKQIDGAEKTAIDQENDLKITTQRTFDPRTGQEKIIEKLIRLSSGEEIAGNRSTAFSETKRETILDFYRRFRSQQASNQHFWTEEYPKMSLEDRKGFWVAYFYRDMRTMGEIGEDQLTIFSPETYREYKRLDPEFDLILDYLAEVLPIAFGMEEEIQQKIRTMRSQT